MDKNFKDMFTELKQVTTASIKEHENNPGIILVKKVISTLDSVLKIMDKYLKKNGIDAGKIVESGKEKAKSLYESGNNLYQESKKNGITATAKKAALNTVGKIRDALKSDETDQGPPPEDESNAEAVKRLGKKAVKKVANKTIDAFGWVKDRASKLLAPEEEKESEEVAEEEEASEEASPSNRKKKIHKKTPAERKTAKKKKPVKRRSLRKASHSEIPVADEEVQEEKPGLFKKARSKILGLMPGKKAKLGAALSSGVTSKAASLFGKIFHRSKKEEPTEVTEPPPENKPGILSKIGKTLKRVTEKKPKAKEEESGSTAPEAPKRKSWLTGLQERMNKRAKEVEDEKAASRIKPEKEKETNWDSRIISAIMSVGGMLLGGLKLAGGLIVSGLAKSVLGKFLSGGATKVIGKTVGGAAKMLGKGGWWAAKQLAKRALPMAARALPWIARGAGMLLSGPVGWAVAAVSLVGAGFALYKYLKRNDLTSDIYGKLTQLRLYMYGFNDLNKEYYSKIFDIEMAIKANVTYSNYKVSITKLDEDTTEKILDVFGVSREDKDKYAILNKWFMYRFIPAYTAYLQALYSVNSKVYFDSLESLAPGDIVNFMSKLVIPTSIFDVYVVPTFNNTTDVMVKKQDVDALYANICNEAKAKSKAPLAKTAEQKIKDENKAKADKAAADAKAAASKKAAPVKPPEPPKQPPATPLSPDTEQPPAEQGGMGDAQEKAVGKLNGATGDLVPGGMTLEGISTKLDKTKIYNLDPNVRELFTGMAKEYKSLTGKDIPVSEAFRTYAEQAAFYKKDPSKAAAPGKSTHEFGLALDIGRGVSKELDEMGLLRKYGFTVPIGKEDWHIEPIGVSINPTEAKADINFRNDAVLASPGNGGKGYGLLADSVLKKRDTKYQIKIYKSNTTAPLDMSKVNAATIANSNTSKNGNNTVAKDDGSGSSQNTSSPNSMTNKTPRGGYAGSMSSDSNPSYGGAGNVPTTNTPIIKEGTVPSLDSNNQEGNKNLDIGKYANLSPKQAIHQAAEMVGIDERTMLAFAQMESGFRATVKNGKSSASGLYQITGPTWSESLKKYGPKYNLPPNADKNNPFYNSIIAFEYAKAGLSRLKGYKEAGIPEATALYLLHHYGPSGASKIIAQAKDNPNVDMSKAVSPGSYASNRRELQGKTVSAYVASIGGRINEASIAAGAGSIPSEADTGITKMSTVGHRSTVATADDGGVTKMSTVGHRSSVRKTAMQGSTDQEYTKMSTVGRRSSLPVNDPLPSVAMAPTVVPPFVPDKAPEPSVAASQVPYEKMFNTDSLESVMTEQLASLSQIAALLTSIDGKFDLDKLSSAYAKTDTPTVPSSLPKEYDKGISPTSVDMSRRRIVA